MNEEIDKRDPYDINIYYEDILEQEDYGDIKFIYKDQEKIVIKDLKVNKKLAITKETIGNIEELARINSNLNDVNGYGYMIGDYVEIDLRSFISLSFLGDDATIYSITFYIGNVKISVRSVSDIYCFLEDIKYGHDTYLDNYIFTMSLYGITKNNYTDYFNMALFILWTIPKDDNGTHIYEFITKEIDAVNFEELRFSEVFYFYNEALSIIDAEISMLYFYKIIEYFFLVVRKEEVKTIIDNYLANKNIDMVIDKLIKINKEQELLQLTVLLKSLNNNIEGIITNAYYLNIISSNNITIFAQELYKYRNSVVHGKSSDKFDLKLPNPLINNTEELFWKETIKSISELLIKKYCIKAKCKIQ